MDNSFSDTHCAGESWETKTDVALEENNEKSSAWFSLACGWQTLFKEPMKYVH